MSECYVTEQLCTARRNMDNERFGRDKSRLEKVEQRLDDNEKWMHEISECVVKLTTLYEVQAKTTDDHEDRITEIEKKPATYWNKVVISVITGIAGALVGAVMAIILNGGV